MDAGGIGVPYLRDRRRMIESLQAAGVADLAILHAFDAVPRHLFVPDAIRQRAYDDVALPLGHGQTISRPGVHALHLSLARLQGAERVLEVGTGSGYQTALLAQLAARVYSIESVPELARQARERLAGLGIENVVLRAGDGSPGWPEEAPFDAILVGAAAPRVPEPLRAQLGVGGRLVIPVGDDRQQRLLRLTRTGADTMEEEEIDGARFVPLIGREGW